MLKIIIYLQLCNLITAQNLNDEVEIIYPQRVESYKLLEHLMNVDLTNDLNDETPDDVLKVWHKCDKDLSEPQGVAKYFDLPFFMKILRNLSPFSTPLMQMRFFLFRREFPDCGQEIHLTDDTSALLASGFNARQPTRIIVHGWMSQSLGSFNRDVKNAYLARGNFNVIVVDWSANAANLNYFAVVKMIESFGAFLAKLVKHLHHNIAVRYDDIYIIGHSLGAQIAGAAGKRIQPYKLNTIFALDPAGPQFRSNSMEFRIDATDAKYVESIQTSGLYLGFRNPQGNATFYPNFGLLQSKCFFIGCSHIRAYKMFAESIISGIGFWGRRCLRRQPKWLCEMSSMYKMGGEPSSPKSGLFYVKTKATAPYALGKNYD